MGSTTLWRPLVALTASVAQNWSSGTVGAFKTPRENIFVHTLPWPSKVAAVEGALAK